LREICPPKKCTPKSGAVNGTITGKLLKEVMKGNMLTPQQVAQLKHLSSPIRVECHQGTVRAGPNQQQVVCEGIVLKTAKLQSKIAMELLSMLPEKLLGEHYRIIPKSLGNILGYKLYGRIVAGTVNRIPVISVLARIFYS
jgi:hypothetical protein